MIKVVWGSNVNYFKDIKGLEANYKTINNKPSHLKDQNDTKQSKTLPGMVGMVQIKKVKKMTVYTFTINGVQHQTAYTSLKRCCENAGLPYASAWKGKRCWAKNTSIITLIELPVEKIKGRGNNNLKPVK